MSNTTEYQSGMIEMRERIIALLYHKYCHYRTFHGPESELALMMKNTILEIRDDEAKDLETVTP
jgi:hypothetical protein